MRLVTSENKEQGAAVVEAALSLIIVMTFVMTAFSLTSTVLSRSRWHEYIETRFSNAAIQYGSVSRIDDAVRDGDKYHCVEDEEIPFPQCATRQYPDCLPDMPAGCFSTLMVTRLPDIDAFALEVTMRVPCVSCQLLSSKKYIEFQIKSIKAGG